VLKWQSIIYWRLSKIKDFKCKLVEDKLSDVANAYIVFVIATGNILARKVSYGRVLMSLLSSREKALGFLDIL